MLGWFVAFFFFWKCGPVKKKSKNTSGVWRFFVEKLCRSQDWDDWWRFPV